MGGRVVLMFTRQSDVRNQVHVVPILTRQTSEKAIWSYKLKLTFVEFLYL